jgi:hypothetical protein
VGSKGLGVLHMESTASYFSSTSVVQVYRGEVGVAQVYFKAMGVLPMEPEEARRDASRQGLMPVACNTWAVCKCKAGCEAAQGMVVHERLTLPWSWGVCPLCA